MKITWALPIAFLVTISYAGEHRPNQSGTLLRMDSVECGAEQKSGKTFAGEMLGTDSGNKKTRVVLCQEYVLQTDRVIYRIRPKDEKHPALLTVGTRAQFRLEKDKMKLQMEDLDSKERDYIVVSMTPREEGPQTASAR